jgi:hypothetical protein
MAIPSEEKPNETFDAITVNEERQTDFVDDWRERNPKPTRFARLPDKGPVLSVLGNASKSWDAVADKTHYAVKSACGALFGLAASSFDTMVAAGGAQVFISGRHTLKETYENYRSYRQDVEEAKANRDGAGKKAWIHTKGVVNTAIPTVKLAAKTSLMMFAAYAGSKVNPVYGGGIAALGAGFLSSMRQNHIETKQEIAPDLEAKNDRLFKQNLSIVASTLAADIVAKEEFIPEQAVDLINTGSVTAAAVVVVGGGILYAAKCIKANKEKKKEAKAAEQDNAENANEAEISDISPDAVNDEGDAVNDEGIEEIKAEVIPDNELSDEAQEALRQRRENTK